MLDRNEISKRGYLKEDFRLFHLKDSRAQKVDYHYHAFDKLILLLGGKAIRVLKDYQKQRRAGKNPVYRYDEVGVGSPEIWNEAHAKKWED